MLSEFERTGRARSHAQQGSEVDVVDAAVMPAGDAPKLLPEEGAPGGLVHSMHCWLDQHMGTAAQRPGAACS